MKKYLGAHQTCRQESRRVGNHSSEARIIHRVGTCPTPVQFSCGDSGSGSSGSGRGSCAFAVAPVAVSSNVPEFSSR